VTALKIVLEFGRPPNRQIGRAASFKNSSYESIWKTLRLGHQPASHGKLADAANSRQPRACRERGRELRATDNQLAIVSPWQTGILN